MTAQVLIVDDMADTRMLLRLMLGRKAGYDIMEARSGQEALDHIAQNTIDLVILDYMMPDLDGVQVLEQMSTFPTSSQPPVIMLTARTDYQIREKAMNAGAAHFMCKPVEIKELLSVSQSLIKRS